MIEFLSAFNSWLVTHTELVTVIGIPLIAYLVTNVATKSAEKRALEERVLERELRAKERLLERELSRKMKLADFRQEWINGLRDDIAEIASLTVNPEDLKGDRVHELNKRTGRVRLRLNLTETRSQDLLNAMNTAAQSKQEDDGALQTLLVDAGQALLKFEWDRLKDELSEVEKLKGQQ